MSIPIDNELLGLIHVNAERLARFTVPLYIIEMVPESVARENVVLPVAFKHGILFVLTSNPDDQELAQKLCFILNQGIWLLQAPRAAIEAAINRHYGFTETESVDSALMEFTDTQITFAEAEQTPGHAGDVARSEETARKEAFACDEDADDACADATAAAPEAASAPAVAGRFKRQARPVQRQATVRHYHRMNPVRMFPLLVVLSRGQIKEIVKRKVSQANSKPFEVELDSIVEVEPILPGCSCYPPKTAMSVREAETSTTFWVVPQVLGQIMQARVQIRQRDNVLAEVPLQMRVVKQGLTVLLGTLSLVLPLLLVVLKQYRLDFESQLADGFGLYAQLLDYLIRNVAPEALFVFLLVATLAAYLWLRPRQRDVFWDIETAPPR